MCVCGYISTSPSSWATIMSKEHSPCFPAAYSLLGSKNNKICNSSPAELLLWARSLF